MHAKYRLGRSNIHGVGLFAAEDLKAGQLIYTASPLLDVNISQEQFDSLSQSERDEIKWWGFRIPETGLWHVDFDVTKFINHSDKPTVTQDSGHVEAYLVTTRDVKAGEELTQDYGEFESEEDLIRRGIRNQ